MFPFKYLLFYFFVALCVFFGGCGSAERKSPDEDAILDTHLSSTDLRSTSQQMARSIVTTANISSNKPTIIGFAVVENRTGDLDFDSYNLLDKIRQLILENSNQKLQFVDRASINRIVAEKRWRKINNENYKELKKLLGIDYFLVVEGQGGLDRSLVELAHGIIHVFPAIFNHHAGDYLVDRRLQEGNYGHNRDNGPENNGHSFFPFPENSQDILEAVFAFMPFRVCGQLFHLIQKVKIYCLS